MRKISSGFFPNRLCRKRKVIFRISSLQIYFKVGSFSFGHHFQKQTSWIFKVHLNELRGKRRVENRKELLRQKELHFQVSLSAQHKCVFSSFSVSRQQFSWKCSSSSSHRAKLIWDAQVNNSLGFGLKRMQAIPTKLTWSRHCPWGQKYVNILHSANCFFSSSSCHFFRSFLFSLTSIAFTIF